MKKYRIKEINGMLYPQERFLFFFWVDIKLRDRVFRDWFIKSVQNNCYGSMVTYQVAKDAWGVTHCLKPEFKTLIQAKIFVEEYTKFLVEIHQKQKVKYYY